MSIYSANRLANGGSNYVRPTLSYVGTAGLARIKHECALNDFALFEAALMNDMREINGIQEGTILESEFGVLREASIKGFFESVKNMLRKLGAKIQSVFQTVIANISKYVVRNGKAFVNVNRDRILKNIGKFGDKKIDNYRKMTHNPVDLAKGMEKMKDVFTYSALEKNAEKSKDDISKEFCNTYDYLKSANGDIGKIDEAIKDYCFGSEETVRLSSFTRSEIAEMMANLSKPNGKYIKDARKAADNAKKAINKAIDEVDNAQKKAENAAKNDKKDADTKVFDGMRTVASTYQSIVTSATSGVIAAIRFNMKQDRAVLTKMASGIKVTSENAILEAMLMEEATDEVDEIFDSVDDVTEDDVAAADDAFEAAEDDED